MICSQCKQEFGSLSAYDGHICGVALARFDEEDEGPVRTDFGNNEGESWDTPEETQSAISQMAASRAGARIRASSGLPLISRVHAPIIGVLGQEPEELERQRVQHMPPEPLRPRHEIQARPDDTLMRQAMQVVVKEAFRDLRAEIDGIREDIRANTGVLKLADVPLEAVADAHERASSSFENLRHDMADVSKRFSEVESVIDTAGLLEASNRAEERFEALAQAIKTQLTDNSKAMVQVLKLLQKLHDRELEGSTSRLSRLMKRGKKR